MSDSFDTTSATRREIATAMSYASMLVSEMILAETRERIDRAISLYSESTIEDRISNSLKFVGFVTNQLAVVDMVLGDYSGAKELFEYSERKVCALLEENEQSIFQELPGGHHDKQ